MQQNAIVKVNFNNSVWCCRKQQKLQHNWATTLRTNKQATTSNNKRLNLCIFKVACHKRCMQLAEIHIQTCHRLANHLKGLYTFSFDNLPLYTNLLQLILLTALYPLNVLFPICLFFSMNYSVKRVSIEYFIILMHLYVHIMSVCKSSTFVFQTIQCIRSSEFLENAAYT